MVFKMNEGSNNEIEIKDFPGGPKTFEICAKFCYGMIVTLSAYNVVAARCAAEYLEMTEDVDKGNLIYKIEVFLNSSVFRSWKDSIIVLQTTKSLLPWSEELKVIGRCIDSIASKTSVDPSNVNWSYTHNKRMASSDQIVEDAMRQQQKMVPKDWWIEDICELDIDLYKRVMVAIKSKGRMSGDVIGEALKAYALRWLPNAMESLTSDEYVIRNRTLVETIVWLLPSEKGAGCSCSFLLKLLKVVILVGVGDALREELVNRIALQLDEALVNDLLIPASSPDNTVYDEHPDLTKVEKKKLCGLMDVKRLSTDACVHAAQNERLPLRVVVQVLFFEQVRAAAGGGLSAPPINVSHDSSRSTSNTNTEEEDWERTTADHDDYESVKKQLQQTKIDHGEKKVKKSGGDKKGGFLLSSRSRKIFDKMWVGKTESKSSETTNSGSSQSPTSVNPGETKSFGSSSRNRRYSVS
ncbi:BTB/POZ domain-containing protein NPY1 [Acorus gramineus]|uniref:BTB/POZ domain-containing protein NPY1 n=1 Tax=Acorus gramineus TaxID=55184 RepID=A0AAV9BHG9_ACOGR|nr:BTB/POZ domain-containing protein NPY1 [Acorus gramineus]